MFRSKFNKIVDIVRQERNRALSQHGPLKAGPVRWERLISEEYQEVCDELATLAHFGSNAPPISRQAAVAELAQLAQLCIGIIELIQAGKLQEEE